MVWLYWKLLPAQALFTVLTVLCTVFDAVLLSCVLHQRFKNKAKGPFVYIVFMTTAGIMCKICEIFMVVSWPISELLEVEGGYEAYREWIGKEITLVFTFSYLVPLFLNWLMTFHRLSILLTPIKSAKWFGELQLFMMSSAITVDVLIWLLIPYFSNCFLNFNALTSRVESACAPGRHPITLFQNKFLIYIPLISMLVNSALIFHLKLARCLKSGTGIFSKSHVKRENVMIRQALFIGAYLSVYEILYLHLRLYPEHFESLPLEFQSTSYDLRLFAIASLNFFVYFVQTKSTRNLVLTTLGFKPTNRIEVAPTNASRS